MNTKWYPLYKDMLLETILEVAMDPQHSDLDKNSDSLFTNHDKLEITFKDIWKMAQSLNILRHYPAREWWLSESCVGLILESLVKVLVKTQQTTYKPVVLNYLHNAVCNKKFTSAEVSTRPVNIGCTTSQQCFDRPGFLTEYWSEYEGLCEDKDLLIIPLGHNFHYTLAVVDLAANTITFYDSMYIVHYHS